MSNFHTFGEGKVEMIRGESYNQHMLVALCDLDEPHKMDGPARVREDGEAPPLHSTILHFPTKVAYDRYMRIMAQYGESFVWKE